MDQYESKNNEFNENYFAYYIKNADIILRIYFIWKKNHQNFSYFLMFWEEKIGVIIGLWPSASTLLMITPINPKNIINEKYKYVQDSILKITSLFIFNSYISREYQNELKILMKNIIK